MLLRHTLLYLPAQCITPLVQLVSIIIWAHLLPPADVGLVTLIIAIQDMSFAAFFTWWSHYALRFITGFRDAAGRGRFLGTEGVAVALSTGLQLAIVTPLLAVFFPDQMTAGLLAAAIVFMTTRSLNNYMSERARAEAHIALYSIQQIGGPLFGLLIGLGLIAAGRPGVSSIFIGFIVAQGVCVGLSFAMSDVGRNGLRLDRTILRKAAGFGVPVMLASMLALVAMNAPRFIVEHFDGLAAVGRFSVGYGLGLRASSFAVMLVTAGAYPLVVRRMEREGLAAAYDQLGKNITLVALAVIPVAFGLLAVNTAVVDLMVPQDYRAVTYVVLPCATIGGLLRYLRAHTTDQVFLVRSRTTFTTLISTIDLVFAVASSGVGLWLYGIPGAAIGPMVSGAVTFTASLLLAQVLLDFRVPVRAFAAIVTAAAVMGVVVYLLPTGLGFVGLGLRIAVGGVVYAVGVAALLPLGRQLVASGFDRAMAFRRDRLVRAR